MASSPIPSWQIDGETMKTVTDFTFLGSKITADGDFSHDFKTFDTLQKNFRGCKFCSSLTAAMRLKDSYSLEGKL